MNDRVECAAARWLPGSTVPEMECSIGCAQGGIYNEELDRCVCNPDTPTTCTGTAEEVSATCLTAIDSNCAGANADESACTAAGSCTFTPASGDEPATCATTLVATCEAASESTCTTTIVDACAGATADRSTCAAAGACTFTPASGGEPASCTTSIVAECADASVRNVGMSRRLAQQRTEFQILCLSSTSPSRWYGSFKSYCLTHLLLESESQNDKRF